MVHYKVVQFTDSQLYACGRLGGDVAGRVRYDRESRLIRWLMPGGRERAFEVAELVADEPERFEFLDPYGRRLVLEPLSLKAYNGRVRHELGPDNAPMATEAALLEAFEQSLSYPPVVDVA